MYSGLLPKGLSEADLSPDEEEEESPLQEDKQNTRTDTETQKYPADSDQNVQNDTSSSSSPPDSCLPGVSQDLWQKFKGLQKERETQKMDKVPVRKRGKKRHRNGETQKQPGSATEEKRDDEEVRLKKWEELTQYFGTNERFQPPPCSRPSPKSGLEKSMERAIAEGDYGKAEELSDRLATRELISQKLAVKIAQASDCRDFDRARREEEDSIAARRKRKQIAWGFEAKKRWETKSNMGFM
ncbi:hypothetical protein QTP70_023494 [Hemibagrus guttatus]|uniref:Protein FAM204A n=1 Tax=Hemibagrus guttatus TaxID=175788 RepID=A0AAE0RID5_9TELE|nr:hypothetical protein QTP70_023494 [Hemibagrus guttatus]KAK3573679.1 hypothetical protein QTP86_030780 [Hemibagrus guttatus]